MGQKKTRKKVIIGDNFSSHFSPDVIKLCDEQTFHLSVSFLTARIYLNCLMWLIPDPLKRKWQAILKFMETMESKFGFSSNDVLPKE